MTEELINKLREITPEEQKILEGHRSIEKELYMDAESDVVMPENFWTREN